MTNVKTVSTHDDDDSELPVWRAETTDCAPSAEWLRVAALMGQRVRTPHGIGTLIGGTPDFNGLYVEFPRTTWVVWYGTENAQSGWVSHTYYTDEIHGVL